MDVDYYIEDTKIREILDSLSPPVNRNYKKLYQDYIGYVISDSDTRDKINAQNKSKNKISHRAVRSSLSLVLKKTSKILEERPYRNNSHLENQTYETKADIKPTIKVTIIPKKDPNCLFGILDPKTEKNTKENATSNNENSIATKNVYLVVAGNTKDKIYEIKATGNKSKNRYEDVRVDTKRFPSKMEKKRRKSLNFDEKVNNQKCANCSCTCPKHEDLDLSLEDEYPNGSSRVRIVGRIGLNEDDKYVMKCAATVNGQPVRTNYVPVQAVIPGIHERINDARRDTTHETTPVRFSFSDENIFEPTTSTTSQATQVDASMQLTRFCSTTDRNTQCNLCELCNNIENSNSDKESKSTDLNRSSSPLVIISVYPKPELKTYTQNVIDNKSVSRFAMQNHQPAQLNETVKCNNFAVNTDLYDVRAISPNRINIPRCCPCDTAIKNAQTTRDEDTKAVNTARINRVSRSPSPGKRSPKSKTQDRKKDFTETVAKSKSRSPSPNRLNTKKEQTNQRDINSGKQTKKVSTVTKRTDVRKQQIETLRSKSKAYNKSVNTVKDQDKFAKNTAVNKKRGNVKQIAIKNDNKPRHYETALKKSLLKNDISTVSVNIDSEKEFYDVIFEKANSNTGVIVRRTAKDNFSQKHFEEQLDQNYEYNGERFSDSLENFFPIPGTGHHRRSASQSFNNNENTDVFPLTTNNISRLNVRDSLEIGHRRDQSKDSKIHTSIHCIENNVDNNFFAPIKHFPGDDCMIDPIERDKEIRELLGIDKKREVNKPTDNTSEVPKKEKENKRNTCGVNTPRRCIFDNTLCKSIAKNPTIHLSYSSEKNQNYNKIHIPRRDEEKNIADNEVHNLRKHGRCKKILKRNVHNIVKVAVMTKQQSTQYIAQKMMNQQLHNKPINQQLEYKKKAILLSAKHYRKVKKLMHKINIDWKKERHIWNNSIVSVRSVKAKRKNEYIVHYNKDVQTDSLPKNSENQNSKVNVLNSAEDNRTIVLFCKDKTGQINEKTRNEVRKVASSIEIRYTSIACSNIGQPSLKCSPIKDIKYKNDMNLIWKRHDSIETIFKGHKKSFTPNLGTSSLSLVSEEVKSTAESLPTDTKPRKPFLRRLMSCLVMRSETTPMKVTKGKPKLPILNSSLDSYHISTSLGAMDMSSSIYDTSVSFYSDHSIGIVNNKTKRGFFSSVREFLYLKKN